MSNLFLPLHPLQIVLLITNNRMVGILNKIKSMVTKIKFNTKPDYVKMPKKKNSLQHIGGIH